MLIPMNPLNTRPRINAARSAKPTIVHASPQYFLLTPKNPSAAPANNLSSDKTIVARIELLLKTDSAVSLGRRNHSVAQGVLNHLSKPKNAIDLEFVRFPQWIQADIGT